MKQSEGIMLNVDKKLYEWDLDEAKVKEVG